MTETLRDVRLTEMGGDGLRNGDALTALASETGAYAEELRAAMTRLEGLLRAVDHGLRVSQPPIPGKLGIRWWLTNGRDTSKGLRMPVLVAWQKSHGKRWRAKALRLLRRNMMNDQGAAALCVDDAYVLAQQGRVLIERYGALRKELEACHRRLKVCRNGLHRLMDETEARIVGHHQLAVNKLLKAGYDVDAEFGAIPDEYLVD